jgi:hypothetical protein
MPRSANDSVCTGFFFASTHLGLGHAIGVGSLIVLAPTVLALYRYRLAGGWRWIYLCGATTLLYLNAFIGVWQAFAKIAVLHQLAPTPSAPPFLAAHWSCWRDRRRQRRSRREAPATHHASPVAGGDGSAISARPAAPAGHERCRDEHVSAAILRSSAVRASGAGAGTTTLCAYCFPCSAMCVWG